jgi:hypothetical protein
MTMWSVQSLCTWTLECVTIRTVSSRRSCSMSFVKEHGEIRRILLVPTETMRLKNNMIHLFSNMVVARKWPTFAGVTAVHSMAIDDPHGWLRY